MLASILENRIIVLVVVLIAMVLGLLATFSIPVQMIPDLDVRVVDVQTRWPGATPQDVEQEILAEQERYLRTLPDLVRMTSTAESGGANIELEFPASADVTDMMVRVNNALSQVARYPENVDEPRLEASSFSANSFIFMRVEPLEGNPRQLEMPRMFDFIDDQVRPQFERVAGVSQVNVSGGSERQIRILVDPASLAERGITLTELREAIRSRNRNVSAGAIEAGKRSYLVRTLGRFESIDEFSELVLRSDDGSKVLLQDVAEVTAAYYRMNSYATANGTGVITLSVDRQPGSNVLEIHKGIVEVIEELNEYVLNPRGLRVVISSDDVRYVRASIQNVWQNLMIGAVMATLVLFWFLRSPASTLIGVVGIPICAIAAFLGLQLLGRTVNVISLAGIAFSLGMTLDNTIVVLEGIDQRRRQGMQVFEAAIASVRQVWPAVLASTATTVIVFMPILFIESEAGQLYSDIAIATSASIIASMGVAVFLVPVLCSYLKRPPSDKTGVDASHKVVGLVRWLSATAQRRRTVLASTVVTVLSIVWFLTPPAAYLPEGEEAKAFSRMIAPPGYNLAEMNEVAKEVQAFLVPHIQADDESWRTGNSDVPPMRYFSLWISPNSLFMVSEPKNEADIQALMDSINAHFRSYPGMRAFSSRGSIISSNQGGTRSVNLDITGPDLDSVYQVARAGIAYAERAFQDPQIGSSPNSLSVDQPFIEVRPDWNRAAELGFTAADIGFSVAALSDGAFVDEYFSDAEKIDVYLYSDKGEFQDVSKLSDIPLFAPIGQIVPLSSVAQLKETVGTDAVRRVNGQRTVTLNVVPPRGIALEEAVEIVRAEVLDAMIADGEIPTAVNVDITGASDQLMQTQSQLTDSYLVAVVLCYLVMVAIFSHWGWPLAILATAPLGIAGGILGLVSLNGFSEVLQLFGMSAAQQPFDMITMLGFLILLGLVVNNPILIIHRTLDGLRAGQSIEPAVLDALRSRIRPITMSLLTTLVGLAPLVFLPGAGTELYRGVGAIVLFGLLAATLLSLTFLPVLLISIGQLIQARIRSEKLA